jgi:hypothetical protein
MAHDLSDRHANKAISYGACAVAMRNFVES